LRNVFILFYFILPIIYGHQLSVNVSIIANHLHPYMWARVGGAGKLMLKVIEFHPPLSHVMAAQALVSSTTAPPSTSSGRWKGQWTFSAKDLPD
jgi:hypothetical protein